MTTPDTDLLAGLSAQDATDLLARGRRQRLEAGASLFQLGTVAAAIYLVERGRIRLTLPIHLGGRSEEVAVEERLPGQLVGWSGLVPPHRFTLSASAPLETDVLELARVDLEQFFGARPGAGYRVCRNLATIVGQRLQVVQAMWLREMQRGLQRQNG
ncbi:MAG: cyclic nucleotide-binding domain-containing protein [Vicinamibacteria bacterium]|nr:cyclic nucleotide-binding domain-containing protein [Vicinamibacteria bacterium]